MGSETSQNVTKVKALKFCCGFSSSSVYSMCKEANTLGYTGNRNLERSGLASSDTNCLHEIANYVIEKATNATKLTTHIMDMNLNTTVYPVYKTRNSFSVEV